MKQTKQNKPAEKIYDDMETLPVLDMPKIDVTKYIGRKAKIERAFITDSQFGRVIKLETEILDTIGEGSTKVEIKATKMLGLFQDENGTYGIGKGSKAHEVLEQYGVTGYKEMIGKIVIVQATEPKNGVQFLTFT